MKPSCPICKKKPSESVWVVRNGHYYRKSDSRLLQRFYCRCCNKSFSTATQSACFGQKRRRLNEPIRKLLCSGVSMRRIAWILGCDFKTVGRKMEFLARRAQRRLNGGIPSVMSVQFDDMETFEHTKCKPISITLAVESGTRRILGIAVSPIAAKGRLAKIARKKYGVRRSGRKEARRQLFSNLRCRVQENAEFMSDRDPHYSATVREFFPRARHLTVKGRRGCVTGQGELKAGGFDPLFSINHTAAMFRANVSRLFRKTWNTTKKMECLKWHLLIYAEFHNFQLLKSTG